MRLVQWLKHKSAKAPPPAFSRWCTNLVIFALVNLALMVMGSLTLSRHVTAEREISHDWVVHSHEVLDAAAQLRHGAAAALNAKQAYLLAEDPAVLLAYRAVLARIERTVAALGHKVSGDPAQVERLARIEGRLDYLTGNIAHVIALVDAGRRDEALALARADDTRRAVDLFIQDLDAFERVQRRLLAARKAERERSARMAERYGFVLAVAGVLLLGVGVFAVHALRELLARLRYMQSELERASRTDDLTGLANRRETLAALGRQMAAERRHGRPLSLAILDIDHFKRVNDTFGHPAGDEVLRRVAQLMVEIMREQDLVGRLGGEEFIIVLPNTDARAAMIACDRLRSAISGTTLLLEDGRTLSITLSAGIAQMAAGDEHGSLIARADDALYRAKATGRDRVLLAA